MVSAFPAIENLRIQAIVVEKFGAAGENPNAFKNITEPIKDTSMQVVIEGLAPGEYAIGVIHDENADGKLKTWFFGPPKEGVGMSGEAGGMMPSFDKSKFTLADKDLEFTIKMKYIL